MPELPEVERYRRLAHDAGLGRVVGGVDAHDAWILKGGTGAAELTDALVGRSLVAARRRGKLLMLDTSDDGPVLGLRFGMTGRLVVDGATGIDAPTRAEERWDRFALRFADGGHLRLQDPRRLGGVQLDPDEDRLGPDALSISRGQLAAALARSQAPLKARLLDQHHVAGIGNLIADEILWRAGLSPLRPSGSLGRAEVRRLHHHLRSGLAVLIERGGAHTGDLGPHRRPGGHCPRDGTELRRSIIGGRSSWWCPGHQR